MYTSGFPTHMAEVTSRVVKLYAQRSLQEEYTGRYDAVTGLLICVRKVGDLSAGLLLSSCEGSSQHISGCFAYEQITPLPLLPTSQEPSRSNIGPVVWSTLGGTLNTASADDRLFHHQ